MKSNKSSSTIAPRYVLATIGYEGRTVDSFFHALQFAGVTTLVDVRQRAGSRKASFAKTALAKFLARVGIAYHHLPELGTPAELRKQYRDRALSLDQYLALFGQYLSSQDAAMAELADMVARQTCCLLCVEASHLECHRSIIVKQLLPRFAYELTVQHL